jgi:hypothetical protein
MRAIKRSSSICPIPISYQEASSGKPEQEAVNVFLMMKNYSKLLDAAWLMTYYIRI